jgi:hypothetical protein
MNWGTSDYKETSQNSRTTFRGHEGNCLRGKTLTGRSPPGGLVLAQLQLGKVQLLVLQEYPAASLLDTGRVIPPSCASTAVNNAGSNQAGRMVEYYSNMEACGRQRKTWAELR